MGIQGNPRRQLDLRGDEKTYFSKFLVGIFDIQLLKYCSDCPYREIKSVSTSSKVCRNVKEYVKDINAIEKVGPHASQCEDFVTLARYQFKDGVPLPVYRIEVDYGFLKEGLYTKLPESNLPSSISILGTDYKLFAATLAQPPLSPGALGHFVGIFYTRDGKFLYDGMQPQLRRLNQALKNSYVTYAYYTKALGTFQMH